MRRFWLAFVITVLPCAAGAFSHDDVVNDLSGNHLAPTALVATLGANVLTGTTVVGDLDYLTISLPGGLQIASLVLDSVTSVDNVAFIAVQQGTTFSDPGTATPGVLLGYAHFGTGPAAGGATPGNDMLDDLGLAAGAIGFAPPLGAADYTFWIQQTQAQAFGYSMTFNVVPEPGTFALLGLGLLALSGTRRTPRSA
jgi:hypothetical protein